VTLLSGVSLASAESEPADSEQQAAHMTRGVDRLLDNLTALSSVSLEADVVVVFDRSLGPDAPSMPIGEPIMGSFRFIASGEGWRKGSVLDPDKYPGMNVEVADDGEWHQYFDHASGTLSIGVSGPARATGMELPNPFLSLGQFLISPMEQEQSVEVPFAEMRARAGLFDSSSLHPDGAGSLVLDAHSEDGDPGQRSVLTPGREDDTGLIKSIERIDPQGRLLTRTRFEDWSPADDAVPGPGVALWPRLVTFHAYDPGTAEQVGSIQMRITALETGGLRVDPFDAFRLNWSLAENFWISDEEVFIR
jgi:hypothetical protein